jgi:hypothetical protein
LTKEELIKEIHSFKDEIECRK